MLRDVAWCCVVLRVAFYVLRVACCVLRVACCVLLSIVMIVLLSTQYHCVSLRHGVGRVLFLALCVVLCGVVWCCVVLSGVEWC
jgi:hypothetical protein